VNQWQQELASNPRAQVYIASIYKAAGKQELAWAALSKALEQTPPTQTAETRNLISVAPEFKDSVEVKEFQTALATESKVKQTSCTGGSDCNTCSLKEKCEKNK